VVGWLEALSPGDAKRHSGYAEDLARLARP